MKPLLVAVLGIGIVVWIATVIPSELVVKNGAVSENSQLALTAAENLSLATTSERSIPVRPVSSSEDALNARFAGLLSHVRWLIQREDSNGSAAANSARDDSLIWRQIDSMLDDIGSDTSDSVAQSNTVALSTADELTVSGALEVGGTTTLTDATVDSLTIANNLSLNGPLFDSSATSGSNGMVLQATSGGVAWVATSSLGIVSGGGSGGSSLFTDAGASSYLTSLTDNLGIGTTSPYTKLSVAGNLALTGGIFDNAASLGTSGMILQTTGSGISWTATTSLNFSLTDTTGTLGVTRGGTGLTSAATGDLIYASGANTFSNRTIGTTGQVLSVSGGLPVWISTSTLGFSAAFANSAQLASLLSDETGSGAAVFGSAPTISNPTFTGTATTTNLVVGTDFLSDITGTGLIVSNNALSVSSSSLNLRLTGLGDVSLAGPSNGQLFSYNGINWTNVATSTLNINLVNTTGTLGVTRGGTGLTNVATGDLLFGSAANTLTALSAGADGAVLQLSGGVPAWVSTSSLGIFGGSGGSGVSDWLLTTNVYGQSALAPSTTQNLVITGTGTSTFAGGVEAWRQVSAATFYATSTTATSTFAGNVSVDGVLKVGTSSIYLHGSGTSTFSNGATFATAGGQVAIGTSTPSGSSLFTVGTSSPALTVSNQNGAVGIGTTTGSASLTIQGITNTTALLVAQSTGETALAVESDGYLSAFLRGLVQRFTVDSGSAAISAGSVVALNGGNVTAPSANQTANLRPGTAAAQGAFSVKAMTQLSENVFVEILKATGASPILRIATLQTDGTFTYGPTLAAGYGTAANYLAMDALSTTSFVVHANNGNGTNSGVYVYTVTGTTISLAGSSVTVGSDTTNVAVDALSATHFIAAFTRSTTTEEVAAEVCSHVSGVTSCGTQAVITSDSGLIELFDVRALSSARAVILFRNENISDNTLLVVPVRITGTTMDVGEQTVLASSNNGFKGLEYLSQNSFLFLDEAGRIQTGRIAGTGDSFSINAQEVSPSDIAFSADGSKMFVVGGTGDDVNEYTLGTAYDISTATFVDSFSVAIEENAPTDVAFSADGTKMFVLGSTGDDVNEYTLSTGFDVSTASFVDSFSVTLQETVPTGLAFSADGTKMFIVGQTGDDVNEYTLGTGFDVSTASFVDSFSVATQENSPEDVAFSADGTRMFILGNTGDDVNEYTLSVGFDVSTAAFSNKKAYSFNSYETTPTGFFFRPNGQMLYLVGSASDTVRAYTLNAAWNTETLVYHKVLLGAATIPPITVDDAVYTSSESQFRPVVSANNGTSITIAGVDNSDNGILSTAAVNSSHGNESGYLNVAAQDTTPEGVAMSADGMKMFVVGSAGDDINEYNLATAFDASSATFVDSFSVAGQETTPVDVAFSTNGTKMFVLGLAGTDVNEYTLGTGFDVSTASFVDSFSVSGQETIPEGLAFSADGTKMFVVGQTGQDVNEYTLGTGFDVSTASFVDSFSVSGQETTPHGVTFSADGTRMFIVGLTGDDVNEYTLSTGFDVSTASFTGETFSTILNPSGVFLSDSDTTLTVVSLSSSEINSYHLTTAKNLATATNGITFSDNVTAFTSVTTRGINLIAAGPTNLVVGYETAAYTGFIMPISRPYALSSPLFGIAKTGGSVGDSISVVTSGTVDGLSGLTAGATYYYNPQTLSLTTIPSPYRVGLALTTSSLLLSSSGSIGEDTSLFSSTGVGNFLSLGVATTTPWGTLSVGFNGLTTPAFVVASSSNANLIVSALGNVGVGTSSPWRTLSVSGTASLAGLSLNTGAATASLCLSSNNEVTRNTDNETCIASSERFKESIRSLDISLFDSLPDAATSTLVLATSTATSTLDALLGLRAVSFTYIGDEAATTHFGFIAEEVMAINPHLVSFDDSGLPNGIRWSHISTLLVDGFQTLYAMVTEALQRLTGAEERIEQLEARLAALEAEQVAGTAVSMSTDSDHSDADTTPPVIELIGSSPTYIDIGTPYVDPGVTVTDNQDQALTVRLYQYITDTALGTSELQEVPQVLIDTSSAGEFSVTYRVTDSAGNVGEVVRNIIVGSVSGESPITEEEEPIIPVNEVVVDSVTEPTEAPISETTQSTDGGAGEASQSTTE